MPCGSRACGLHPSFAFCILHFEFAFPEVASMPRVIGIDPGTISTDICGLDNGRLFLDESVRTADAVADPGRFVARLEAHAPIDLIAGPSGYGLPFVAGRDVTETDLRLAFLAA